MLTQSAILWYVTGSFIKLLLYNCFCLLPRAVCNSQRALVLSFVGWLLWDWWKVWADFFFFIGELHSGALPYVDDSIPNVPIFCLPQSRVDPEFQGLKVIIDCPQPYKSSFLTIYPTHSPQIGVKPGPISAAIKTQIRRVSLQHCSPQSLEHSPIQCPSDQQHSNFQT